MATKIGVYFDRSAIGGGLDVDGLVEHVETRWSDIALVVKDFPVLAAPSALEEIKTDIADNELDGVLICGTSPRVDWDIYRFEGIQVDRVSLREGCVLAYQNPDGSPLSGDVDADAPELLTAMAIDYVNMGVIKLQKSELPVPEIISSYETILVLGGGWTGMNAALAASKAGYKTVVVEKEAALGGKALNMHKTFPLNFPYTDLAPMPVQEKVEEINENADITVLLSSELKLLAGAPGQYIATIATPEGELKLEIGSVVLATGWKPLEGKFLAPLGYGSSPRIVTSAEFELMARDGKVDADRVAFIVNVTSCVPTAEEVAAEAAAKEAASKETATQAASADGEDDDIQVEEFKDMESAKHLTYSNGVSSIVALKQASYIAERPNGLAYVIYDSMVVQGVFERFYKAVQDNNQILLTKGVIDGVEPVGDASVLVKVSDTLIGEALELDVDMVVVPTGMVPTTAKAPIMEFGYRLGPAFPDLDLFDGYADSNYICFPYETRRTGVYAAGGVRQPMTFSDSADDANGAVLKAIQCIESINHGASVHPRSGDLSYPIFNFLRCTQCKRCTEECPFGALDDDEKGTPKPNSSRCRRCGTCMGACPERCISFENYNIDQIGSMIRCIDVPDDMKEGGPRVLILACENDAYPAFDMAAMRGKTWSPYVRIIPVRCLGSVNAIWIADAMSKGIDGVMLMGCKYGDDYQCHFVKGSEICSRRRDNIAETLGRLGIEADRVVQHEVAIDEYDTIPFMVEEFMEMIFEKGPNPFKGY